TFGRNGVAVGGGQRTRNVDPFATSLVDEPVDEVAGALAAAVLLDGAQGVDPFGGFDGVEVARRVHLARLLCDGLVTPADALSPRSSQHACHAARGAACLPSR